MVAILVAAKRSYRRNYSFHNGDGNIRFYFMGYAMSENMTIHSVLPYIWPHIDFGKKQVCAKFLGYASHKHGETVEFESHLELLGNGLKINDPRLPPNKYKGVFRLLETGLYRDDWMAAALPIAKEYWEKQQSEYLDNGK